LKGRARLIRRYAATNLLSHCTFNTLEFWGKALQINLDSPTPKLHDLHRGPGRNTRI